MNILSVESQKGAIDIQRCSVENQKGAIAVQSLRWQHLSGSQIVPFWLSTDNMQTFFYTDRAL